MPRLALLLACTLVLGGCLESTEEFRLKADGTGSVTQSYIVDVKARTELAQTAAVLYGGSLDPKDMPFANPVAPGWVKALAARTSGYTVKEATESEKEGKRTTSVRATFDSLEAAAKAGAFFPLTVRLERKDESTWRLTCHGAWQKVMGASSEQLGGQNATALLGAFEVQLKGLSFTRTFVMPTKVLDTNGSLEGDGFTVIWKVDYRDLLESKDLDLHIDFRQEEGLKLEPFQYRPDPQAMMTRCLEAPPGASKARGPTTPTTPTETDGEGEDATEAKPDEKKEDDGKKEGDGEGAATE